MRRRVCGPLLAFVGLASTAATIPAQTPRKAEVSRVSVEMTKKGDVTVSLSRVPDVEFTPAEGKAVSLFGVPGATATDDDGFFVVSHKFDSAAAVATFGPGLRSEQGVLVADTGTAKDAIGPRVALNHPRRFGLPFTVECDVVRHGAIVKTEPSQAGRSLNFNLAVESGDQRGHLYVSLQPTDTRYTSGVVAASWASAGGPLKEVRRANIKDGVARLRVTVPGMPAEGEVRWYTVVRGDNAHLKRLRCAGPLRPLYGMELEGSAGQVVVRRVLDGGPAAAAGFKDGDQVVAVTGERIRDVPTALDQLSRTPIQGSVEVEVRRDGTAHKFMLTAR